MKTSKKIIWKIRWMMVNAGIHTATELKRRLDDIDYEITTAYAARIVNEVPSRLSIELLTALITVLKCEPGDLLISEPISDDENGKPQETKDTNPAPKKGRKIDMSPSTPEKRSRITPKQVVGDIDDEAFFGPRLKPMPNPYEGKV